MAAYLTYEALEQKKVPQVFRYQPLDHSSAEIRLIRIFPSYSTLHNSQGSLSHESVLRDPITCQVEHFSLGDDPPQRSGAALDWEASFENPLPAPCPQWRYDWGDFVALSYTWGDTLESRNIMINGSPVTIGSNLEAALRSLRTRMPIEQGYLVWIDALCINQDDLDERNEEVKRMRSIYKAAQHVVVWLGNEQNDSKTAVQMIKDLAMACEEGVNHEQGVKLCESFTAGSWKALGQFFNRQYWDRLWIMQELALGSSQTPVLCGKDTVRWGQIYHAIYTFGSRHVDVMFSGIERECRAAGVRYSGLNRNKIIHLWAEGDVQSGRAPPQFMPMLDLSRKAKTTDSRDKVYGMLGLMPPEVADTIQPDYHLSIGKVYISFAKVWITTTRSLELLEQCTSPNADLPSWVPDWTNTNHFRLYSGRSTYHATSDKTPVLRFSQDDTVLSVKGMKIGEIDGLGASYYEDHLATTSEDAKIQPTNSTDAYGSNQGLRQAVWQTLTGNRTPNGKVAPGTYQCLVQCPLTLEDVDPSQGAWRGRKAFTHLLRQNKDLRVAGQALGSFFPTTGTSDPAGSKDALERVFRFHRARRLAVTTQGHLGVVPIASRRGDEVFLLLGCNVPMVLRRIGRSTYQLVGGCYLHGFMEGEAGQVLEDANVHLQMIDLC